MTYALIQPGSRSGFRYSNQRRALQAALVATFPFFLAATVVRRLTTRTQPARVPLATEARMRAAAIIPFIFMG